MHHHAGMHVIDPDVFIAAVAQRLHGRCCALPGFFVGHGALGAQRVEMHGNAMSHLDHLAHTGLSLFKYQLAFGNQEPGRHHPHAKKGEQHQKGEFSCNGHGARLK